MGMSIVAEVRAMRDEVEEIEGSLRRERVAIKERGDMGGRY